MELRNLITFTHVAELGSFTKAAEQLGYSQSTISFQIKQLEEELGCLLFERINHTITLTQRGHELVSYAHRIRALTDEFKESLAKDEEFIGHIHIVTPDSVCDEMITPIILISTTNTLISPSSSPRQIHRLCSICLTITKRILSSLWIITLITRIISLQKKNSFPCTLLQAQARSLQALKGFLSRT